MLNIDAEDMLEYLIEDEGTRLIFVYLESIQNGRRLMEVARKSASRSWSSNRISASWGRTSP
jgi:acyl-CoA synthetase (NDP forming)